MHLQQKRLFKAFKSNSQHSTHLSQLCIGKLICRIQHFVRVKFMFSNRLADIFRLACFQKHADKIILCKNIQGQAHKANIASK